MFSTYCRGRIVVIIGDFSMILVNVLEISNFVGLVIVFGDDVVVNFNAGIFGFIGDVFSITLSFLSAMAS